jgi:hypothetical protein
MDLSIEQPWKLSRTCFTVIILGSRCTSSTSRHPSSLDTWVLTSSGKSPFTSMVKQTNVVIDTSNENGICEFCTALWIKGRSLRWNSSNIVYLFAWMNPITSSWLGNFSRSILSIHGPQQSNHV